MKRVLLFSLITYFTFSCKRIVENPPISKENIVGVWLLTAMAMTATGVPQQDAFTTMEACEKDNLYYFNADYSFTYLDTGITCEMNQPFLGLWELHDNAIAFMGHVGYITKFEDSNMEITVGVTDAASGTVFTIKYNFRKV